MSALNTQRKNFVKLCFLLIFSTLVGCSRVSYLSNGASVQTSKSHYIETWRFELALDFFLKELESKGYDTSLFEKHFSSRRYKIIVKKESFSCFYDKERLCSGLHFKNKEENQWYIWIVYDKRIGKTSIIHEWLHMFFPHQKDHPNIRVWELACYKKHKDKASIEVCREKTLEYHLERGLQFLEKRVELNKRQKSFLIEGD